LFVNNDHTFRTRSLLLFLRKTSRTTTRPSQQTSFHTRRDPTPIRYHEVQHPYRDCARLQHAGVQRPAERPRPRGSSSTRHRSKDHGPHATQCAISASDCHSLWHRLPQAFGRLRARLVQEPARGRQEPVALTLPRHDNIDVDVDFDCYCPCIGCRVDPNLSGKSLNPACSSRYCGSWATTNTL
jgi:hypothetical protein